MGKRFGRGVAFKGGLNEGADGGEICVRVL